MIQVVLCDDHAVLRRGIRDTLQEATDIRVTAEAASYTELRDALRTATCEVIGWIAWKASAEHGSALHEASVF